MTDNMHRMKTALILTLALSLHARTGLARERLECVLPQGGRIVMEAHCKAPPGVREHECGTWYDASYLPAGGGAAVALGHIPLKRPDDAATPAAMCARFYVMGDAVHAPRADNGQYPRIADGKVTFLTAQRPGHAEVEMQASRHSAPEILTYTGYRRIAASGTKWLLEEALTRRYRGHYAGDGSERAPLSHVTQMHSTDQGASWSEPVVTSTSTLFSMGKSVLDQPAAAKPAFAPEEDKRRDRRSRLENGKPVLMRCRLPDQSEFILSGKQANDEERKREWGGQLSAFIPLVSIAYTAAAGSEAIEVEPELSLLSLMADVPRPKRDEHCGTAGQANGVPYIGVTMLDRDRKRFTRFAYPEKIWYPATLPRAAAESLKRHDLTWGEQVEPVVAVTRRGKVVALEYPVVPEGCGGSDPRRVRPSVCTVSAVLRSESRDNGMTWSDLEFSATSWIFAPGKPVDRQPGRASLVGE